MRLLYFLLPLTFNLFSQVDIEYQEIEGASKLYNYNYWSYIDTASMAESNRYNNGQLIYWYYFKDLDKVDSLFTYFPNGQVAMEAKISNYSERVNDFNLKVEIPNYSKKTFYESGHLRSIERNFYLNSEWFNSYKFYRDGEENPFYSLTYIFEDTISDLTPIYFVDKIQYVRSKCGESLEMWTIAGINPKDKKVMSFFDYKRNKTIEKTSKLKRVMRKYKFYYLDHKLIIKPK